VIEVYFHIQAVTYLSVLYVQLQGSDTPLSHTYYETSQKICGRDGNGRRVKNWRYCRFVFF